MEHYIWCGMFNAPLLYRVGDFPNWKKVVQQVVEKDRTVLQNWKVCVPTVRFG